MPRLELEGFPLHIVQRGNDRQACFRSVEDRRRYLALLRDVAHRHGCAVHAYVLMTNHVHLLLTPLEAGAASSMMQTLGRRYVGEFNARHRRTGTLWEGRFKSSLVGGAAYVMACYRYIELNPVRARMVAGPGDYPWSSYGANALGAADPILRPHDAYIALGEGPARLVAYRALVATGLEADTLDAIRANVQQGRAFASTGFQEDVAVRCGACARIRSRGHQPGHEVDPRITARRILRK